MQNRKKIFKIGIIILFAVIGCYMLVSLYFINHFYFGSQINSISISGKTLEEVDEEVESISKNYCLTIIGRDNIEDTILGKDIDLNYNIKNTVEEMKDNQNPLMWITTLFMDHSSKDRDGINFNESKLDDIINKLCFFNGKNIVEPKDAIIEIDNGEVKIVDEILGNKVDKNKIKNEIVNAIKEGESKIFISDACYMFPKYISTSSKILEAQSIIKRYLDTSINYNFINKKYTIDKKIISKWINVDTKYNVSINKDAVLKKVKEIAKMFDTVGIERQFKTAENKIVKVSGGDYGWKIDTEDEANSIINLLEEGKGIEKEFCFEQSANVANQNDIGNTYVEINLSKQHLWFYENGRLITEGDVVTGNLMNGCATPSGVYKLDFKQKNATLRGDNYASFVNFWMPFNYGIGIHDASWRSCFGGQIYKTNGSHGCVNAPYNLAKTIYEKIKVGTPIICYY